jgi:cytochrome c oxidase subunit 3
VLIASSFTCQMGVFAAERGDVFGLRAGMSSPFLMGLFFVLGQGYEYIHLVEHGTTISSSAYGSVFYLPTGFHGLHVIGAASSPSSSCWRAPPMSKFTPAQATQRSSSRTTGISSTSSGSRCFATIYFVR